MMTFHHIMTFHHMMIMHHQKWSACPSKGLPASEGPDQRVRRSHLQFLLCQQILWVSIIRCKYHIAQKNIHSTWQNNVFKLLYFHNSEVTSKWLQRVKLTSPWPTPSAWNFAKHWPPRARLSTSPWTWAPPSPSPWTPGARLWLWLAAEPVLRKKESPSTRRGEMPGGE